MSADNWLTEFRGLTLSFLGSLAGWLLITPVAALIPKRKDCVVMIGRQHGKFLDNTKYFFLQAAVHAPYLDIRFLTEHDNVRGYFAKHQWLVLPYPSLSAFLFLMRCGTVVVDSTDWFRHLRRFFLIRSHVLQLWHGVGFKRIELDKWRNETGRYHLFSNPQLLRLRLLFYRITGRSPHYHAVNSTSAFYRDNVFGPAFVSDHLPVCGYPRNTFGRVPGTDQELLWNNVDEGIKRSLNGWLGANRRLVAVTPTMRDSGKPAMNLDSSTMEMLHGFCETHCVELLFKFHPSDKSASKIFGKHLHLCSADSDIYPLLPFTSALITDYSSIYMDYLCLDKPILFFIPGGDDYTQEDREIQFSLDEMTPGPRCATWNQLIASMVAQWQADGYVGERARLRKLAFDDIPQEQATVKLIQFMREQCWIHSPG